MRLFVKAEFPLVVKAKELKTNIVLYCWEYSVCVSFT